MKIDIRVVKSIIGAIVFSYNIIHIYFNSLLLNWMPNSLFVDSVHTKNFNIMKV